MRVTSNSFSESLVTNLQALSRRQVNLQEQIATGQKVRDASDDPMAAQQILNLRDESVANSQFQKNIEVHREYATASHGAMRSLSRILDRAQEIAFTADGLESAEDLKSYAIEVSELLKEAVQVANSKHRGEFLLSGTLSNTAPFAATTNAAGEITGVTFQGNTTLPESEIAPGVLVTSRVAGENRSGAGERGLLADDRAGADLFGHLIALRDQLQAGDAEAIRTTTRGQLAADEENLLSHIAANGAFQSRLETTLSTTKDAELTNSSELSKRTNIDLAETIVRLTQQQTNYQAALQSAGGMMELNLLSFLR